MCEADEAVSASGKVCRGCGSVYTIHCFVYGSTILDTELITCKIPDGKKVMWQLSNENSFYQLLFTLGKLGKTYV